VWPGKQALSYTEANAAGFRMSPTEWDSFNGVCGHQHVPENTHWDPGAFDWTRLLLEDEVTTEELIKEIQTAINQTGVTPPLTVDGVWGVKTRNRFAAAMMIGEGTPGPEGPAGKDGKDGKPVTLTITADTTL
jgi:hypothetical protein